MYNYMITYQTNVCFRDRIYMYIEEVTSACFRKAFVFIIKQTYVAIQTLS